MSNKKIIIKENEMIMKFTPEQKILKTDTINKLRQFWKKKDYKSIIEIAKKSITSLPDRAFGEGDSEMSEIYYLLSSALREIDKNNEDLKKYALLSAKFNRFSKNSMWLIREINNQFSEKSKLMRLQVLGDFYFMNKNEEIKQTFKTIYSVVAESKEEAMEFIKEFERDEIKNTLRIDKFYEYGLKPELPKGVYETMKLFTWLDKKDYEEPK